MLLEYRTVYKGGEGEITEKKSRFIATVIPASTEEEALTFIEAMKKKYWNAAHNCSAYVIGERAEVKRCSDDGEPGQTAGKPMLEVLLGEELTNTAVVVTRYFGGTLLGTGGLIRAYTAAAKAGLASSIIITKTPAFKLKITTDYTGLGKIQYILSEQKIPILDSVYTEKAELEALVPVLREEEILTALTEATSAKALLTRGASCHYAIIDNEVRLF